MFRTILILAICSVAVNSRMPCQGGELANNIYQSNQLIKQLKIARTKFKDTLPSFPEYQDVQRWVAESVDAISAARRADDSQQLDLAIKDKITAEKELASIAEKLAAQDADIAAIRAQIQKLAARRVDLLKDADKWRNGPKNK